MSRLAWLNERSDPDWFPPISQALTEPSGLLAAGGDLSPRRLLSAYRRGIFPWFAQHQPILWWSPDPRMVMFPAEFKPARSLSKTLRNGPYTVQFDRSFAATIQACAGPRKSGPETWLNGAMIAAYRQLHLMGYAHSIETYHADALVGGLYGLRLGRVFFGESMFSLERDASKVAFAHLIDWCRRESIELIDCQVASRHLHTLGAREITRERFAQLLVQWLDAPATAQTS
jgi:leucyl/phenylalanyl-tRNA---protein transferase